jgi:hypothetical protein
MELESFHRVRSMWSPTRRWSGTKILLPVAPRASGRPEMTSQWRVYYRDGTSETIALPVRIVAVPDAW